MLTAYVRCVHSSFFNGSNTLEHTLGRNHISEPKVAKLFHILVHLYSIQEHKLLKMANINARSLCNKMNDLEYLVTEVVEPQIISTSESWDRGDIADCNFNLDGYKMYRDDRHRRGGGAILYIKSELNQRECKTLMPLNYESSAWCWIIENGGKKTLVGSIYRSTSSSPENDENLLKLIEKAYEIVEENRLLLLGEFNVPKIDWENHDLKQGARNIEINLLKTKNY